MPPIFPVGSNLYIDRMICALRYGKKAWLWRFQGRYGTACGTEQRCYDRPGEETVRLRTLSIVWLIAHHWGPLQLVNENRYYLHLDHDVKPMRRKQGNRLNSGIWPVCTRSNKEHPADTANRLHYPAE